MVCRDFILPEPASYVFFYAVFNLRNLLYIIVVNPTLSVMVNGNAVNGYHMVNRADVGGKYQGTWQTATASWVTIIRRLWNTPTLPKTGY